MRIPVICIVLCMSLSVASGEELFTYGAFLKHGSVMLLIDEQTRTILDANQAAVDFYGYDIDTLRRMHMGQINILPDASAQRALQLHREAPTQYAHFQHRLASGEIRQVEVFTWLFERQGRKVRLSTVRDLSAGSDLIYLLDRVYTQDRFAEQIAGFGHWTLDRNSMRIFLTEGAAAILGIGDQQISYDELHAMVVPEDRITLDHFHQNLLEFGMRSEQTLQITRADGKSAFVRIFASYDPFTNVLTGVINDITEHTRTLDRQQHQATLFIIVLGVLVVGQFVIITLLMHFRKLRKRAESNLQERETELSSLVASMQDILFVFDQDGHIRSFHAPDPESLLSSPKKFLGKHFQSVLPAAVSCKLEQALDEVNATGLPSQFSYSLDLHGQKRHYLALVSQMRGSASGSCGYLAVVRDVTTQEQSRHLLALQEKQFRALVENTQDLVLRFDRDGRILFANIAFEMTTGFAREDFSGKTLQQISFADDIEKLLRLSIEDVFTSGIPKVIEFSYMGMVELQYFECQITPEIDLECDIVFDSETALCFDTVLAVCRDITARKRNEDGIRRSHSFFLSLLDNFPTMVWRTGPAGHYDYFNSTWLAFIPTDVSTPFEGNINQLIHPDDYDRYTEAFWKAFHARENFELEYRLRHHSGEYREILDVGRPIYDLDDVFAGFIGTCYDISERFRAEERLREKDKLLLIQSRQAAMGEMIGNIAHQWRQPLTSLSTTLEEIQDAREFGELTDAYFDSMVSKSMEAIDYMSRTIDDFRNFFKPDREKVPFCPEGVLKRSLALIDASLKSHGITVSIEHLPCQHGRVSGYPNEYAQVLINIINNARDVLVERHVAHPAIRVRIEGRDAECMLSIEDNAGGISTDPIDRVFEPYFSTKGPGHGTGIGLYMAKEIIEKNMGGTLSVANTREGAMFMITLRK